MTTTSSASQRMRRYPGLAFVLAAAVLASLLPSALRVPLSGPSQVAELAPVPGSSNGVGDLSALGTAGGLGMGGQGGGGVHGGLGAGVPPLSGEGPQAGEGRQPSTKRCVGTPPRQTEDPLSPPCVAYFEGDNGGATATGVTANDITILFLACGNPGSPDVVVDFRDGDPTDDEPDYLLAYQRYFTDRYQLYGRQARFVQFTFSCDGPEPVRAKARDAYDRFRPFAAMLRPLDVSLLRTATDELLSRGVIVLRNTSRAEAQRWAPLLLSYPPDYDDRAEIEAGFVCRKLAGRPAVHSGNVGDRSLTRKFGLIVDAQAIGGGVQAETSVIDQDLLLAALDRRCGIRGVPVAREVPGQPHGRAVQLQELRDKGVTTLLYYSRYADWSLAAESIKWYPEWFVGSTRGDPLTARYYAAAVWANAFGLTYERRRGPVASQPSYVAYREGCPDCTNTGSDPSRTYDYDNLAMLFWGIQAAGPRLTPASLDKGMHAAAQSRPLHPGGLLHARELLLGQGCGGAVVGCRRGLLPPGRRGSSVPRQRLDRGRRRHQGEGRVGYAALHGPRLTGADGELLSTGLPAALRGVSTTHPGCGDAYA